MPFTTHNDQKPVTSTLPIAATCVIVAGTTINALSAARLVAPAAGGRLALHNGLTRFKQEAYRSVWSDLKQLAWLSR
jgi:hypothetical protein